MDNALYELLHQCTVLLAQPNSQSHGTGFFVAPGLILTCAHVVAEVHRYPQNLTIFWGTQECQGHRIECFCGGDIALVEVTSFCGHPCVSLDEDITPFDMLYSYGYPAAHDSGDSATFKAEGWTRAENEVLLKFKAGQVEPGMSGAPLLNIRTGRVCGIIALTRDRSTDRGGRAIWTRTIWRVIPTLKEQQYQFHRVDQRWATSLKSFRPRRSSMKALIADHSGFMRDRLAGWVGREKELAGIRKRIDDMQQTGGYVTITGPAGQGKSCLIAKLVEERGPEKVAFHFIPFNAGPDHQVELMRSLMARLILKYDLSDLYVVSESRPALRGYFPKVLEEVAAKGGKEVIFIDGLDQLVEDVIGGRDLSFLPNCLPKGIVFVLGTRPNDTLRLLEPLKPHDEYQLPNLSREDFDRVLQHRNVPPLENALVDRYYTVMQGNALYLDLLAKELIEQDTTAPEALIKQVAVNPEHVFSLTMDRFREQRPEEWGKVIKPVLGVLLVAQEPLGERPIRQILGVDGDRLREGIQRLGGLIERDRQEHYSLFHLKFYEYLRQKESCTRKEYIFASDEEEEWHRKMAQWCEPAHPDLGSQESAYNPAEQPRRKYARQHYMTHLYRARHWQRLFEVLDTAQYGKTRISNDPSTRSYAQDLDLGRQAASWEGWTFKEGIALLPRLWRYTFLRCSLASRADLCPLSVFQLLPLLKRTQEAVELAELITKPENKVRALLWIVRQLRKQSDQEKEWLELLLRVGEITCTIEDSKERTSALSALAEALAEAQQWEQARAVIDTIEEGGMRGWAMRDLARGLVEAQQWEQALAAWEQARAVIDMIPNDFQAWVMVDLAIAWTQAQRWEQAQAVISVIRDKFYRVRTLANLGTALAQAQRREQAQAIWEQARAVIDTIEKRDRAMVLVDLGTAQAQARQLTQAQTVWEQARTLVDTIEDNVYRVRSLAALGTALAHIQQGAQAHTFWEQAQDVAGAIDRRTRAWVLRELAGTIAQAQHWEQAQTVINTIENRWERANALVDLAIALTQAQRVDQAQTAWEQARALISMVEDSEKRTEALGALAVALTETQQWERAQAVINRMESHLIHRVRALANLLIALIRGQHLDQAQAVWKEAYTVISTIPNSHDQIDALRDLAKILINAQLWGMAQDTIDKIQSPDKYRRAVLLKTLIKALAQAQQWEQVQAIINRIEKQGWEHNGIRVETLIDLATSLIREQRWEQALAIINRIENSEKLDKPLQGWGNASFGGPLEEDFGTIMDQVFTHMQAIIDRMGNRYQRVKALTDLGTALAQVQHLDQAQSAWEQARALIGTVEDNVAQVKMFAALAIALIQAQQEAQAQSAWEQARALIGMVEDGKKRAETWLHLAIASAQAQLWEQVQSAWKQARAILDTVDRKEPVGVLEGSRTIVSALEQALDIFEVRRDNERRSEALRALAITLAQAQHWEQAQEVINAMENWYERSKAGVALAITLAQAQHWEQAQEVINAIEDNEKRAEALRALAKEMASAGEEEACLQVIHHQWRLAESREYSLSLFPIALTFLPRNPELGMALYEAFTWVDSFFLEE